MSILAQLETETSTPATEYLCPKIKKLQGPILVLGGSGFIGANLLRTILSVREDVVGTATRLPAWRLEGISSAHVRVTDLLVNSNLDSLLDEVRPRTIFNCVAYGAYSFETGSELIYQTNFTFVSRLIERLSAAKIACYVHAGSSSEYGDNSAGPRETDTLAPNSEYAVSKAAAANLLHYWGKKKRFPCCNLRLYSVYGPMEDSSRLIPNVVMRGCEGAYPEFVNPAISRDFVYIDDVMEAFLDAALTLEEENYGDSFNIGSGRKTAIDAVAALAGELFDIGRPPVFTMPARKWDVNDWYSNPDKANRSLGWRARTSLPEGLAKTCQWYRGLHDKSAWVQASKQFSLNTKHSVSAVIACYKDGQAIPVMYQRLRAVFMKLQIDYEIIFVNDCSPDDSEEVIRAISQNDRRVTGICHSRNFGSQAAFVSGMRIAAKNACVLLDGDLQDPPELIEKFVAQWRSGFDVVYGRRVKREATVFMQVAYKAFYRVFDWFSYVRIPRDAGDFALMDRRVVQAILSFPERDIFLRGVRAFAGFRQTGVDYIRPERMFGRTTNSFLRNLGWAKKGILSFSNVPLSMLSAGGIVLFAVTFLLMALEALLKLLMPGLAPRGFTTVLLTIGFFGSINLFALGLIGEYLAKIFEEVKQRPLFIRRSVIREGEVRLAAADTARREELLPR